ncbi:MAG TPA: PQQ-binding-like beta-propeller repeat protein [Hyphomonadaceae bacterium]|nr:PQQ-binding-like beta-propeller repeat protein [Hyphomonadaceae bacterium]
MRFSNRSLVSLMAMGALSLLGSCSTEAPQQASSPASQQTAAAAPAGPHPGEAIYKTHCAACHDNPNGSKAPTVQTLNRMPPGQIVNALITGPMIPQATGLTPSEVSYVAEFLSKSGEGDDSWTKAMMCPANRRTPQLNATPTVSTFGFDLKNRRNLTYAQAGLKPTDLSNMEVAWVVGFPDVVTMRSQAAVVGNTIFLPVGENHNRVFAFDVSDKAKPCIQWIYEAEKTIRTSAGYGVRKDGRAVVLIGDMGAMTHMIDAKTGKRIWETHTGLYDASVSTATPVLIGDKVYAPSSQYEIMMAAQDAHVCCKTHGGVTAVDAMTGKIAWQTGTMEDANPLRDRGDGQMLWGPAGAPIWNSPSVDVKRNRLYVGTGEANSENAHPNTDALMSFDLSSGKILWSHQATANDVYNVGCGPTGGAKNCAKSTVYRDVDFGASTILATRPDGKDIVVAGQKAGTVWGMDPDTGAVVWRTDIGTGGPNGGIHWGIAVDDTHVYAPISYPGRSIPETVVPADLKPGLYAVNLQDGKIDWKFEVKPDCTDARKKFVPRCNALFGLSGAPTIVGDHIITGGLDGRIYILDRKTGKLVFQYDTAQDYTTVNGVKANGASVDNASIVAVNGLILVNSGYGLFGQGAGNVMVALKPKS